MRDDDQHGYSPRPLSKTKLRELRVLELKAKGLGFEEIAATCGYANKSGAWKAYHRAVTMSDRGALTDDQARLLQLTRLELLLAAVWDDAMKREPWAVREALRINNSITKLRGVSVAPGRTRGFGDDDDIDDEDGVVVGPDALDRLREGKARREAERTSGR